MASQLQGEHAQASEITIETVRPVRQARKSQRGESFTIDEDKLLISAWLNVSRDVIDGNRQRHKAYWKRVLEYFDNHKKFNSTRNQNSLMNRWSTIQISVTKFCGCFTEIESLYQTDLTEDEKVRKAKEMYKELHKNFFSFEDCWNLLKYEAKWLEKCGNKKQTCKKSVSAPTTTDSANSGDNNVSHTSSVELERSFERKAEKYRLNKRKATEHESANLEVVPIDIEEDKRKTNVQNSEVSEKPFDSEKEKIRLEEERLRLERQREEERIIMMDISGLTPMQATYYQRRQKEILERYENL